MMKYKNAEMHNGETMTSGPIYAETFPKKESVKFDDDEKVMDVGSSPVTQSLESSNRKAIIIIENGDSISYSVEGQWGNHEVIGALELVKATVLSKVAPGNPGIMDRILMSAGIN